MPQPSWTDADRWRSLLDGTGCPLCARVKAGDFVASLETCVVTTDASVRVKGYCCIILKQHRVELHALSGFEGAAFMRDVRRVSAAAQAITGAIKLNYEVHGNVVPHVHMHIIPRYPGDEIERTGKPFAQLEDEVYRDDIFSEYTKKLGGVLG